MRVSEGICKVRNCSKNRRRMKTKKLMPVSCTCSLKKKGRKKKSESGVKIFARVLCVVCDVVGCSIPTSQVCDDASFFFKMIARPHPPPPFPPRHPLRHRLQATIFNCACVLSVTTYSYDKLQEERRPEWRRRKKKKPIYNFSSLLKQAPVNHHSSRAAAPLFFPIIIKNIFFFFSKPLGLVHIFPPSFLFLSCHH